MVKGSTPSKMIKETKISIIGHPRNIKYYSKLGYNIKVRENCLVDPLHLSRGSSVQITCICTNCKTEIKNQFKDYWKYTNGLKESYYCNSCKWIKSEKTSLIRYGVRSPMQNVKVRNKMKETLNHRYGVDYYSQTDDWIEKYKKTSLSKYNVDNPSKLNSIKNQIRDKNRHLMTDKFKCESKLKKERRTHIRYDKLLPDGYISLKYKNSEFTLKHTGCDREFKIAKSLLYNRIKQKVILCLKCNPIQIQFSSFELEVRMFIKELDIDFEVNNRDILNGRELDIYLPKFNFAIECNGIYWHSEIFKSREYHYSKTLECRDNNIELFHIWEDDWRNREYIIKSMIKKRLNIFDYEILETDNIRILNRKECDIFLDKNNLFGSSSSSYRIGLYSSDILVSVMTFRKSKNDYILVEHCDVLHTNIVNSFGILFKYFLDNVKTDRVITYVDTSIYNDVYDKSEFRVDSIALNYHWVVDGERRNKSEYTKSKLIAEGYDSELTEVEIMYNRGYYRIYSNREKWIYSK